MSPGTDDLWARLATELGLSKSEVMTIAIRELGIREGIVADPKDTPRDS